MPTFSASEGSSVLHRELGRSYKSIASGSGVHVYDDEGREYLDAVGGVAVNVIGHGVREITDAIAEYGGRTTFVYGAAFTSPWQERLADRLVDLSPLDGGSAYFLSGGSEANETAIKLARQYHLERGNATKWKVLSRTHSYHGNTLATLAISGRPSWRTPFDPYLTRTPTVAPPYCYRCPFDKTYPSCAIRCADDLERAILQEGADTVSAFVAEPVIGNSLGGVVPVPGYYERVREICDRYDVLFVADEVLSGYGRTGIPFAISHWGVRPDILTVGKGIGSGYVPLAACIADGHVVDVLRNGSSRFVHGFTYSGLSMSCFVGDRVLDYVVEHDLFARAATRGAYLQERLAEATAGVDEVGEVRGRGLLAGIEIVADRETRTPCPREHDVTNRVVAAAEERGVLFREGTPDANYGRGGDLIVISPPYVVTEDQIDQTVDVLLASIKEVIAATPS